MPYWCSDYRRHFGVKIGSANRVEPLWSLLKRGYYGTFHHISEKHLHRYVREVTNRHNARSMDTADIIHAFHTRA